MKDSNTQIGDSFIVPAIIGVSSIVLYCIVTLLFIFYFLFIRHGASINCVSPPNIFIHISPHPAARPEK
jgi:hypothetical protein